MTEECLVNILINMSSDLSSGYLSVSLSHSNGKKKIRIHRLVALHFVTNRDPDKFNIVNHINGNKLDNYYTNLEWTDAKTNNEHAIKMNLTSSNKQKRAVFQYDTGMNLVSEYETLKEASKQSGTNINSIRDCCNGKTNSTKGYIWKFKEEKVKIPCPEEGREVPNWENYIVFRNGTIYSKFLGNFMRTNINEDGYEMVSFKNKKVQQTFSVHSLVAQLFIAKPKGDDLQINHKNGIRNCNNVDNLEYVTASENCKQIFISGAKKDLQKRVFRIHPETKEITVFDNITIASKETKIPYSTIAAAIQGRIELASGFIWQYESEQIKEVSFSIKKIDRVDPITLEILTFNSAKKAAETLQNVTARQIHTACKKGKQIQNYLWKYEGEELRKQDNVKVQKMVIQ
jgi:hypothetical protein